MTEEDSHHDEAHQAELSQLNEWLLSQKNAEKPYPWYRKNGAVYAAMVIFGVGSWILIFWIFSKIL